MKNNNPKVSVVMPTYNRARYIIQSVESVLRQSFVDFELIIINDGSKDNTRDVVKNINDSRIVYVENKKNLGIQKTLNKGIGIARGKYIARIDDQDKWIEKDKLKQQIDYLEKYPECVLVGTGVIFKDINGKELYRYLLPQGDKAIRNILLSKNQFIHSSVVFVKEVCQRVGGYNESKNYQSAQDYDLWLNLGWIGKMANLPLYAVEYYVDNVGISGNKLKQIKENLFFIEKYKDMYPGYVRARLRYAIRIVVYGYADFNFLRRVTAFIKRFMYK